MSLSRNRLPFRYRSIRFRLTALFVTIFGATLILFSALLYRAQIRTHQDEFDTSLYNHAVDFSQAIDVSAFGGLSLHSGILREGEKIFPFSLTRAYFQVRDLNGAIIVKSRSLQDGALPLRREEIGELILNKAKFETLQLGKRPTSYRLIHYFIDRPEFRAILQIAVPLTLLERERAGLLTFFFVAIPLILIVATLGGLYLSRRALAPVMTIIDRAQAIGANQLSQRIPVPQVDDELKYLVLTLNALLERLQEAFESQERFIADASHQLKTPLSILKGELDLIKSRPRSPEEVREFIQSSSQEIDHLSRMVTDLLLLARVDAGTASLSIQKARLDEILLETVSRLEPVAKAKSIRISLNLKSTRPEKSGSPYETSGDPDLLEAMVHNLVENAIKFSPPETMVQVTLQDDGEKISIQVKDEGPGIPPEALPKIFNRFYRSEHTKDQVPGTGLGLAIARRIAQAHRGSIEARSELGKGAVFTADIKIF